MPDGEENIDNDTTPEDEEIDAILADIPTRYPVVELSQDELDASMARIRESVMKRLAEGEPPPLYERLRNSFLKAKRAEQEKRRQERTAKRAPEPSP